MIICLGKKSKKLFNECMKESNTTSIELKAYKNSYDIFYHTLYYYKKYTSEYINVDKALEMLEMIKDGQLKERGLK